MRSRRSTTLALAVVSVMLSGAACSGGSRTPVGWNGRRVSATGPASTTTAAPSATSSTTAASGTSTTAAAAAAGAFTARGSVNQVSVTGAKGSAALELVAADGARKASGHADSQGSLLFRGVEPGRYSVQTRGGKQRSGTVTVTSAEGSLPPQSLYSGQTLKQGFQYITTRDGTTLSASVYLPPGPGPFPTVVEYSGYDPSNPTSSLVDTVGKLGIDGNALCTTITIICKTPAQPSSLLASAMGYAVVAVNVRGTGCSGGAYDFFEPLQLLDGYDVIETVAAQSWARNHKVGMVGLSYPGISQLFVASTRPPHLAAIAPLSVFDDTVRGVLAPGGIFNGGFALRWAKEVLDNARPLGQGWTKKVVDEQHDAQCAANQLLRLQNVDAVAKAQSYAYYTPDVADPVNPTLFVDRIDVPVFMTGAWQDDQTGPRFVNLWDKFTNAPVVKFTAFNGAHADGYSPENLAEWKLFLDFYVAGERTPIPDFIRSFGPQLIADVLGAPVPFPKDRLLQGDFAQLKRQYEAEPRIRIQWDRGSRPDNVGAPQSRGESTFRNWPLGGTAATSWYLQPDGTLASNVPTAAGSASTFAFDPDEGTKRTLPEGGDPFKTNPPYDWQQDAAGNAVVAVTKPLSSDTVIVGGGNADLWIRSTQKDADLGITLSEVRPDGKETYVQTGVLRASMRKPGPGATQLDPHQTMLERDAQPLVPGEWTEVQVPILPVSHVFRAGSRIRISVHTPGGDKPAWSWILQKFAENPTITVGHEAAHASRIVLPVVPGVRGYPSTRPACPSLRGQPCRTYVAYTNTPAG